MVTACQLDLGAGDCDASVHMTFNAKAKAQHEVLCQWITCQLAPCTCHPQRGPKLHLWTPCICCRLEHKPYRCSPHPCPCTAYRATCHAQPQVSEAQQGVLGAMAEGCGACTALGCTGAALGGAGAGAAAGSLPAASCLPTACGWAQLPAGTGAVAACGCVWEAGGVAAAGVAAAGAAAAAAGLALAGAGWVAGPDEAVEGWDAVACAGEDGCACKGLAVRGRFDWVQEMVMDCWQLLDDCSQVPSRRDWKRSLPSATLPGPSVKAADYSPPYKSHTQVLQHPTDVFLIS